MPATIPSLKDQTKLYTLGPAILKCDGDCYFPETFSARRLEKEFGFGRGREKEREQLARSGPAAVAALLQATDKLTPPITRPTSYYAMIQMDGDKMGRLINGVGDQNEHRDISEALSTFSREDVPKIVQIRYPGRLIYAGGDDVFALAPLARDYVQIDDKPEPIKTVLDLVDKLQQQYRTIVQPAVKNTPVEIVTNKATGRGSVRSRKELVTASAGVAIAHHYTSLSYVRRTSKEAEQLAKNHYGRNALVVTVLRRSGTQTRVGCHWHYEGLVSNAQPLPLFLSFYDLFKDDVLSPNCVHTLLEEAPTLVALPIEAQSSEVKRVLLRQRNPAKKEQLPDDEIHHKAAYLVKLAEAMNTAKQEEQPASHKKLEFSVELHSEGRRYGLVEVLGWLLVMLFLARKEQE